MDNLEILEEVIQYIELHLQDAVTAEELSDFCHYSVSNLKYLFRKVFQYGMMDYVSRRKATEAARELVQTDQTVCEVAYRYGYGSQAAFCRSFRKVWGESPGRYRKHHRFSALFPRQEFFCDESLVFRRRFDLTRLREAFTCGGQRFVACFDLVGFRELKATLGREAGEYAALQAIWRLEKAIETAKAKEAAKAKRAAEAKEAAEAIESAETPESKADAGGGTQIFRMAGDRFAVLSDSMNGVREIIRLVLSRNGEAVFYRGEQVPLAMFAGWTILEQTDGENPRLFEKLEAVLLKAHDQMQIQFPKEEAAQFIFHMEESSGLYFCTVFPCRRMSVDGRNGYGTVLGEMRWTYSCVVPFPEGEDRFVWERKRPGSRMFFPDGENLFRQTVYREDGSVMQDHYRVIRDFHVDGEGRAIYQELFLELVCGPDGRIQILNEGELKEAVHDGVIERAEYNQIRKIGKDLLKNLPGI